MKHLQISFQINTDSDPEPEINVTPIDTTLPGNLAGSLEEVINIADLADSNPGDGKFEYSTRIKLPIKIFGITLNINYPITLVIDVVDK